VLISGMPAARIGDPIASGVIVLDCFTVMIN
jgi:uncharacterized Zn-binding protein involved in type VI secretion